MQASVLEALRTHAAADYPRESCGLILKANGQEHYVPCRNLAASDAHFILHPEDYAAAEEAGEVVCIVHSHPNLPPLIGRPFSHGILDCYTLIRDYYQRALRLDLPDFERAPEWWTQGGNLYLDHFDEAGFIEVPLPALQQHDVLLMQNAAPVPNHSAIYLGGGRILQHCQGHLSAESIYGGYWRKCTTHCLRHRNLLNA